MKKLIAISLLLVALTTATMAGTGLTITVQNRTAQVEILDANLYNVTVLGGTKGNTQFMNRETGTLMVEIPKGHDYIELVVTNVKTGETEIVPIHAE